jgi:hypothetical protein
MQTRMAPSAGRALGGSTISGRCRAAHLMDRAHCGMRLCAAPPSLASLEPKDAAASIASTSASAAPAAARSGGAAPSPMFGGSAGGRGGVLQPGGSQVLTTSLIAKAANMTAEEARARARLPCAGCRRCGRCHRCRVLLRARAVINVPTAWSQPSV